MSVALASAMLLQCFFNRPSDGSVAAGDIPVIKAPLSAEMAESLSSKLPPLSRHSFAGEDRPAREWVLGNASDATAASVQLLRVSLSDAQLSPSPYSARFGTAIRTDGGNYQFEEKMAGYCKLLPIDGAQQ
jgi:hypothetical protein